MDTGKTVEKDQDVRILDIIELTDSEEEECGLQTLHRIVHTDTNLDGVVDLTLFQSDSENEATSKPDRHTLGSSADPPVTNEPLYVDDESELEFQIRSDEARLLLKGCKDARKLVHVKTIDRQNANELLLPDGSASVAISTLNVSTVSKRKSKKAESALEREKRIHYAEELFAELNKAIFKNGLPLETKLTWNKRLLTTAGRAKWRRSRDGSHYAEIELSEKILDCKERIRNTLSHEMCHLATWIIDEDPKQVHGKLWKRWASKVMRKRPDIEITTRHNYEISYPYQWRCEKCSKMYGRFSKSIHPDECVCGACKEGKLVPLFMVRKSMQGGDGSAPKIPPSKTVSSSGDTNLGSESEVEILLTALRNVIL